MTMDDEVRHRFADLDRRLDGVEKGLAKLTGSQEVMAQLLKYVVTPLIVIVGALVGVKLIIP